MAEKRLEPEVQQRIKADYAGFRERNRNSFFGTLGDFESAGPSAKEVGPEERERAYEAAWQRGGVTFLNTYDDLMIDRTSNDSAAEFISRKIREIVDDPEVAEALVPHQLFGCKRLCVDTGYFESFNRPNVGLVDVSENPIDEITPEGLKLQKGEAYVLDAIVFATGFDAMTGALLAIDPQGGSGLTLREKWADGPQSFLGIAVHGFPNLFTITGPGSPFVLSNMVPAVEQHVVPELPLLVSRHEHRRQAPHLHALSGLRPLRPEMRRGREQGIPGLRALSLIHSRRLPASGGRGG
jgi:cation diffusion facilitator CzcD-associated flavoprotein CzcO